MLSNQKHIEAVLYNQKAGQDTLFLYEVLRTKCVRILEDMFESRLPGVLL